MGKKKELSPRTEMERRAKKAEKKRAARKRNTSVNAICKLNGIGKNMKLRPGQILKYN